MIGELKADDEEGRMQALERYNILDTDMEKPFDNVVTLVQQTLQLPICAVSLVDRNRQWFKASCGLPVRETPRDISFCTHAIQQGEPFIVNDAPLHALFRDNPLVTGDPNIRAYAGIPLKSPDGYNIGTLCAIDTKSREFQPHEIAILETFAKVVIDEFELRQIAASDGLTGALTRRAWTEAARSEIERAKRYGRPLSIAIMDIDNFKSVNDTHGHPAGDRVIQALAALGMRAMRQSDHFGRLGGEEFVLLMTETTAAEALPIVERLRQTFSETEIGLEGAEAIACTVSAGIAGMWEVETLDTILARADRCLYQAKAGGRNKVVVDNTVAPAFRQAESA